MFFKILQWSYILLFIIILMKPKPVNRQNFFFHKLFYSNLNFSKCPKPPSKCAGCGCDGSYRVLVHFFEEQDDLYEFGYDNLINANPKLKIPICLGAFISERHILTAKSCFHKPRIYHSYPTGSPFYSSIPGCINENKRIKYLNLKGTPQILGSFRMCNKI